MKKRKKAADTHEGVQRVDRWQTTDGELWETEAEAEAWQAGVELREALVADGLPLDVHEADALRLAECLRENAERYIGLLQAIVETHEKVDCQSGELDPMRWGG